MKKINKNGMLRRILRAKVLFIMKLTAFFFFVSTFTLVASVTFSQNKTITIERDNVLIKDVLREIEDQSGYYFIYNNEFVDVYQKIDIHAKNQKIDVLLDKVFQGQNVNYSINNRRIILSPAETHEVALQSRTISGRVTDSSGAPLPGVTIIIKGTTQGAVTKGDGSYLLLNVPGDGMLVFSFIGMKTQEIPVGNQSSISVVMTEDAIGIEEVVAIGYGTIKKADLTGSVTGFKSDIFENERPISTESLLAGRVSGVKVVGGSQPGSGASITIRGANSMSGGTEPLYVIDGVPIELNNDVSTGRTGNEASSSGNVSGLNFIDPEMIERIDVLKDASATAIYGSRGANGVILITTKKGQKGYSKLSFTMSTSISEVTKKLDVLDAEEFGNQRNVASENNAYLIKSWWDYQAQLVGGFQNISPTLQSPNTIQSSPNRTYAQYLTDIERSQGKWIFGEGQDYPSPNSSNLENSDWHEQAFQTAISQKYSLNYNGGSDQGSFAVGVNYLDQEGVLRDSKFSRLNMLMNANRKIGTRLTLISMVNLASAKANAAMTNNGNTSLQNVVSQVARYAPVVGTEESFLTAEFAPANFTDTPTDLLEKLDDDKEMVNVFSKVALNYKIMESLDVEVLGSWASNINERSTYWPMSTQMGAAKGGDATSSYSKFEKYLFQTQANYRKEIGVHNFNATAVYSYEENHDNDLRTWVQVFPSDLLTYHNLSSGLESAIPANFYRDQTLISGLGRVNYTYKNKYLATISLRADGSSKFSKDRKWGYFPSGALAWRVTEESFMSDLELVSNLKLRSSYGRTGGQAVPPYGTLSVLTSTNYPYNGNPAVGYYQANMPSPELTWETTDQFNLGIDLGVLDNRINITLDYYYKKTQDLLMQVDLPPTKGYSQVWDNLGEVENKGLEVEVQAAVLNKGLKWNVSANLSLNRNKVLKMGPGGYQYSNFGFQNNSWLIFKEGQPLCTFWGYEVDGVFSSWEEVYSEDNPQNNAINSQAAPSIMIGDYKYKDLDGDGKLTEADKHALGGPDPDAIWGITNDFSYKGLSLSCLIDGQIGGHLLNLDRYFLERSTTSPANRSSAYYNNQYRPAVADRPDSYWMVNSGNPDEYRYTPSTDYSGWSSFESFGNTDPTTADAMASNSAVENNNKMPSNRFVEDATFIKLRNVSLSYQLPRKFLLGTGLTSVRFIASGSNLLTITDYKGYDPELSAFTKDPSRRGLDYGSYPMARTFTFGVNVGL